MPCVIGNCKRIAGIRRKWHLCLLRLPSIGKHLVKDGANMWRRIVGRQVELLRDAFPEAVRMFEDAISRNVASQDRYRIHSHLCKVRTEPAFQARRESLHEDCLQLFGSEDAARDVPHRTVLQRQMMNVFWKKIDFGSSR